MPGYLNRSIRNEQEERKERIQLIIIVLFLYARNIIFITLL